MNRSRELANDQLDSRRSGEAIRLAEEALTGLARTMPPGKDRTIALLLLQQGHLEQTAGRAHEQMGNDLRSLAAHQRALGAFGKARRMAESCGDREVLAFVLAGVNLSYSSMADIQYRRGRLDAERRCARLAAEAARRRQQLADDPAHREMYVRAMLGLGDIELRAGDPRSAAVAFEELRRFVAGEESVTREQVVIACRLAWAHYCASAWEEGRASYESVLALYERASPDLRPELEMLLGEAHHNLSQIPGTETSSVIAHLRSAVAAFDAALRHAPGEIEPVWRKAAGMSLLARRLAKQNRDECLQLFRDALALLDTGSHPRLLEIKAETFMYLALSEGASGRFSDAVRPLEESAALYEELRAARPDDPGLAHGEARTLMMLSQALFATQRLDEAVPPLERAFASVTSAVENEPANAEYRRTLTEITDMLNPSADL